METEKNGDPDLIVAARKGQERAQLKRARITAITFGVLAVH